jgi:hypothetical protein
MSEAVASLASQAHRRWTRFYVLQETGTTLAAKQIGAAELKGLLGDARRARGAPDNPGSENPSAAPFDNAHNEVLKRRTEHLLNTTPEQRADEYRQILRQQGRKEGR